MKKLFILIMLMFSILVINAQSVNFTAEYFKITTRPSIQWSDWYKTNISILMDIEKRHIEIFSNTPQVIDFGTLSETKFQGGIVYEALASDRNYDTILIGIYIFDDETIWLEITYENIGYIYQFKRE